MSDAWAAPAARRATSTTSGDALEQAKPGTGEVVELPGLAEAARRLRERARPLPQGKPVLQVSDLSIGFEGRHRGVDIVDGLSFDVRPGEVVGLVGSRAPASRSASWP
ncbi:hypothetical protein V2I01_42290 [Micromonospora sp. BRA006-A]|nr:hypothetical protein [Micromonospora sp. BRA006-A]